MDPFTQRRLVKFISDFRLHHGNAPTLKDLEVGGFSQDLVELAVKKGILEMFYVNLTNGSIVKTYRLKSY